jgi:predicted Fe-Mo cluster-binding NifX family protein
MLTCVAVTDEGLVDPRWGRTERVAIADVEGDTIVGWEEFAVSWGTLRQFGSERAHHARVARFLRQHGIETVVARHMGEDMRNMITRMGITVRLGATGEARQAVAMAWQSVQPGRTQEGIEREIDRRDVTEQPDNLIG